MHFFGEGRGQIRLVFYEFQFLTFEAHVNLIRRGLTTTRLQRGAAGRRVSATLDARAQKRTPPFGGTFFGRDPTITGVETPQNFNILLGRSEDNSPGRVWFESKNLTLLNKMNPNRK